MSTKKMLFAGLLLLCVSVLPNASLRVSQNEIRIQKADGGAPIPPPPPDGSGFSVNA